VPTDRIKERFRYFWSEVYADVGLSRIQTFEFWSFLLIVLTMFWITMYVHYIGQYAVLTALGVPIVSFEALPQ
jgi:hypothetical protein